MKSPSSISRLLWLYLPVAVMIVQIIMECVLDHATLRRIHSENGPHEIAQAIVITIALAVAIRAIPKINWETQKLVGWVVIIAALGCFYITGEEISWGQQIINWNTPEYWAHINDQDETNLHNTSTWLDQKPRALLFIGIVIGGLIVPALRRWKPEWLPGALTPLYPSNIIIPSAIGVLVPYLVQHTAHKIFHINLFERVSEVQELYMYYFIFLYLRDLKIRQFSQV